MGGRAGEIRKDCPRVLKRSEPFDDSGTATKEMAAGYLHRRKDVP